jgi:hypothetical protein
MKSGAMTLVTACDVSSVVVGPFLTQILGLNEVAGV